MIVVSDTTPITYLLQIKHEFLLQRLYNKLIVPTAVWDELLQFTQTRKEAGQLFQEDWVTVENPSSLIKLPEQSDIGKGEWKALSLATELGADLVLMNKRLGTSLARQLNLKTIGLLGILIEAKREKHIPAVKSLLDSLIAKRFFLTKDLYNKILLNINE
jgi:predicted nucleic acid-binding protein